MKNTLWIAIIFLLPHAAIIAQTEFWVDMNEMEVRKTPRMAHTFTKLKETSALPHPAAISNVVFSKISVSRENEYYIHALRGNIDGQEVFQIDTDGDLSFMNDSIFSLVDLEMDEGVDYSEIYHYQTKEVYSTIVQFLDSCAIDSIQQEKPMEFKVKAKFDSTSNSLYYTQVVQYGFNYNLKGTVKIGDELLSISVPERFSWDRPFRYFVNLKSGSKGKRVDVNDVVKFGEELISIDSFDYCSRRVLVTNLSSRLNFDSDNL